MYVAAPQEVVQRLAGALVADATEDADGLFVPLLCALEHRVDGLLGRDVFERVEDVLLHEPRLELLEGGQDRLDVPVLLVDLDCVPLRRVVLPVLGFEHVVEALRRELLANRQIVPLLGVLERALEVPGSLEERPDCLGVPVRVEPRVGDRLARRGEVLHSALGTGRRRGEVGVECLPGRADERRHGRDGLTLAVRRPARPRQRRLGGLDRVGDVFGVRPALFLEAVPEVRQPTFERLLWVLVLVGFRELRGLDHLADLV